MLTAQLAGLRGSRVARARLRSPSTPRPATSVTTVLVEPSVWLLFFDDRQAFAPALLQPGG